MAISVPYAERAPVHVTDRPMLFLSDAHFAAYPEKNQPDRLAAYLRVLELVRERQADLVIGGDLVDYWFRYRHAVPRGFETVFSPLRELIATGTTILYFLGNHDFWAEDYLRDDLGIRVFKGPEVIEVSGRRILVGHGDGLAPRDWGYRRLVKPLLRNPLTIRLYGWIHPDLGLPFARAVSSSSRKTTNRRKDLKFIEDYLAWAEVTVQPPLEAVILGHIHVPGEQPLTRGRYFNIGNLFRDFTYVKADSAGIRLCKLDIPIR